MCGIITIIKKKDDGVVTAAAISGMLTEQISRGSQGFGYIGFGDKVETYVRRESRAEIEKCLEKNDSQNIMFHHRLPTSTPNYADCTHPIKVSNPELDYDYYLVHNGVISNDHILKEEHNALGYIYNTTVESITKTANHLDKKEKWNDSEALAIDVARMLDGKKDDISAKGSIAFNCMQVEKGTQVVKKVYFGRNISPLTINFTEDSLVLRSQGESKSIDADRLYTFDPVTFKMESKDLKIGEMISTRYNYGMDDDDRDSWRDYFGERGYSPSGGYHQLPPARSAASREVPGIDTTKESDDYSPSDDDITAIQEAGKIDDKIGDIEILLVEANTELESYMNLNQDGKYDNEIEQINEEITKLENDKEALEEEYNEIMYGDIDLNAEEEE